MEFRLHNLLLSCFASLALLISSTFTVSAEIEDKLGLRFYGSFLYTEKVPNALFFFSDIEKNDSFELRKALRNHNIDILVLSSKGGSVWEGLNMAGIIYDKELITYVPKLGLDGEGNCASACAFMFFGGSTRLADGKLGVHQFYSGSASDSAKIGTTQKVAQFTVSEIIGFLNEFKTPPFVYERMFQQSEMYYFDKKELEKIARVAKPLEQEAQKSISSFINDFKIELASIDVDEGQQDTKTEKKVEPKILPKPKKEKPVVTKKIEEPKPLITTLGEPTKQNDSEFKERVRSFQKELNKRNCDAGIEDGVPGPKTSKAIELFLKTYQLIPIDKDYKEVYFQKELLDIIKNSDTKCPSRPSPKISGALVCDRPVSKFGGYFADHEQLGIERVIIRDFYDRDSGNRHNIAFLRTPGTTHKITLCSKSNCWDEQHKYELPVNKIKKFTGFQALFQPISSNQGEHLIHAEPSFEKGLKIYNIKNQERKIYNKVSIFMIADCR